MAIAIVSSSSAATTEPVSLVAAQRSEPGLTASDLGTRPEEGEVFRIYQAVFGRPPDAGGFDFWLVQRTGGRPLMSIARFFVSSPEFERRFGAATDEELVTLLYRNVLGRSPDAGGRRFWLAQLAGGMSHARIVVLFSESAEFAELTGTVPDTRPAFSVGRSEVTAAHLTGSWEEGCPVGPSDLVALTLSHVTPEGSVETGTLVVHLDVADEVTRFFAAMYDAGMPVEQMAPASEFAGDDDAMMAVNNTSAFNCRRVTGGTSWSQHAFGRAIDINPRFNPYVKGGTVLPPNGVEFVDRAHYHAMLIRDGDALITAVRAAGWTWGGDWNSLKDYQHIQAS